MQQAVFQICFYLFVREREIVAQQADRWHKNITAARVI